MALTPAEILALPSYTNAEMVKLLTWAMAELASNPDQAMVTVAGRSWSQQNLTMLRNVLAEYQRLAAVDAIRAAGGPAAGVAEFGEPTQ